MHANLIGETVVLAGTYFKVVGTLREVREIDGQMEVTLDPAWKVKRSLPEEGLLKVAPLVSGIQFTKIAGKWVLKS